MTWYVRQPAATLRLTESWHGGGLPRVLAMCHARTGHWAVAEELAQETLLRGFRSLASIESPERFGSWICGIARHVCLDWRKSKQSAQVSLSAVTDEESPDQLVASSDNVSRQVQNSEEKSQLLREVERLPQDLREVLMLYYYEDVTYQQLADQLAVSPATINARLTRARALLRQRLSALGDHHAM